MEEQVSKLRKENTGVEAQISKLHEEKTAAEKLQEGVAAASDN